MNILYYYWTENSADDMISSLINMGHQVKRISIPFMDYEYDSKFIVDFQREVEKEDFDFIFTFDFFPSISKVAQSVDMPYISWIYDMPHTTLFSPQLKNPVNHVFIFDYVLYNTLKAKEYPCHLYHLPLPVNTSRLVKKLGAPPLNSGSKFPISFVGSLYDNCLYNQINYLPEYLREYLKLGIEAQQKIYGYDLVNEILDIDIIQELEKWVKLDIPDEYDITYKELFADIYKAKITSEDRIGMLNKIAKDFPVILFSGSGHELVPNVQFGGIVDYMTEMPEVFRTSKINLNITLRSIVSGIPLRALDIMGAGGFLLSNYQAELAEYFVDGEECVLFNSIDDLMNKVEYYLEHDKERTEIACNGFYKTQQCFSYEVQIRKILDVVFPQK